ncbi:MAG: BNR-4 repeat-containing protein [Gemmataceae bacterium]
MSPLARPVPTLLLLGVAAARSVAAPPSGDFSAARPGPAIVLNDDAGWCWFQDERALVHAGQLILGTVAGGRYDTARRGDVEVTSYDLATGRASRHTLHKNLQADDHAAPALLARPDGRLLAVYSRHGTDGLVHYRLGTRPGDATAWGPEQTFVPGERSRVTYSNLHRLARENGGRGRVYNFFRGYQASFKPSWMYSDDDGTTWTAGGLLIDFPAKTLHRPYAKYASDGQDTVHVLFTEGHPRDYDNSIYHAYYRSGRLHRSDGTPIGELASGPIRPDQATRVFAGDRDNVAWTQDLHLDADGRPYVVYSVQKDSAGLPPGKGGVDHRYRYARWDGTRWQDWEIAYAGTRLYPGEDDYTGGICLHPNDPGVAFLSANVDPSTGKGLPGGHYEIFRGESADGGRTWRWAAVTSGSPIDNIRPVVPDWAGGPTALLWLRGRYASYTRYELEAVVRFLPRRMDP